MFHPMLKAGDPLRELLTEITAKHSSLPYPKLRRIVDPLVMLYLDAAPDLHEALLDVYRQLLDTRLGLEVVAARIHEEALRIPMKDRALLQSVAERRGLTRADFLTILYGDSFPNPDPAPDQ